MRTSRLTSLLTSLLLFVFCVTAAIAVPILCRGWYYAQIGSLGLVESTGWSVETIQTAFDEVMDYLVLGAPFGTGALKWSESGMAHFADCRFLFHLDFILLALSAAGLVVLGLVGKARRVVCHRFLGRGPAFWTLMGMTAIFLLLGIWGAVDFTSLFTLFHRVFFPGKTNWIFDARTDEIIRVLPLEFWLRTGALVITLAFAAALTAAVIGHLTYRRRPKTVYEEARLLQGASSGR